MMLETNKEVVRTYLDAALTGGDLSALDATVSNSDLKQRVKGFWAAFTDRLIAMDSIIAEGDYVAAHFNMETKHVGPFWGIDATNKRVSLSCTAMYRLENGKISDYINTWDWMSLFQQR